MTQLNNNNTQREHTTYSHYDPRMSVYLLQLQWTTNSYLFLTFYKKQIFSNMHITVMSVYF